MTALALFLLMSLAAILLLALPFVRRGAAPDRREFDLTVYRDQLAELERDRERGLIDAEAARAARVEIERRILAVAEGEAAAPPPPRRGLSLTTGLAAAVVLVIPVAAGLLYVRLGQPAMPDLPLASRAAPADQLTEQDALLANIEQLEKHLATTPENGAVWTMLGRMRLRAGRATAAVEALDKGVRFSPDDPAIEAELAEAMVYAADGQVTPGALEHFKAALAKLPDDPRARYYLGLALAQEGEVDRAIESWSQLLEVSPSDAPWRPEIVESIRAALESEGRPADQVLADLPRGRAPSQAAAGAGDAIPPDVQDEQIRAMVDGLAARLEDNPGDVQGWLMLGRSRMVLGEPAAARDAFRHAADLAPEQPDVLKSYAASLLRPSETPGGDPRVGEDAAAAYRKLLTLSPQDPEPRWLLGLAAAQAGKDEDAIAEWRALLDLLDQDAADRKIVEARIKALEGGEPAAEIAAGAAPSLAPPAPVPAAATPTAPAGADAGPQPSPADVAAMTDLSKDEQDARIRSMVDGLAARLEDEPGDVEGWLRLAQSRSVLGEPAAAKQAYERAMAAAPDDPDVLRAYAASLLGEAEGAAKLPAVGKDAAALYAKILALAPDDPEAHWYLGLAALQDGRPADARTHWQRVLSVIGPDHPNYAAVQSSLEEVKTETQ